MEKRYFWIKLKEDFFDSEQMDFIHDMPNGAEYIYIYLRLCLRFANNDGIVERRIGPDARHWIQAEVVRWRCWLTQHRGVRLSHASRHARRTDVLNCHGFWFESASSSIPRAEKEVVFS